MPDKVRVPLPSFVKVAVPVAIIVLTVVFPEPPIVKLIFDAVIAVDDLLSVKVSLSELIRTAFVTKVIAPP
ncbi:hypothetical protein PHIN9_13220 [Polynucleobacter sp. HIN9]|nr:hypothetical protein PHIN9_13220 [Polynucleobacter sp. HIN9]